MGAKLVKVQVPYISKAHLLIFYVYITSITGATSTTLQRMAWPLHNTHSPTVIMHLQVLGGMAVVGAAHDDCLVIQQVVLACAQSGLITMMKRIHGGNAVGWSHSR